MVVSRRSSLPPQCYPLIFCALLESWNMNVIWPYLPFMVRYFGVKEERLGYSAGFVGASFFAGQMITGWMWGKLADIRGRRPVLLLGTLGTIVSSLAFGFAPSLPLAIVARSLSGALNGNTSVAKTYLGEVTDKSNQARAFSLLGFVYGLVGIIAPFAGGHLAEPAKLYPSVFEGTLFDKYRYCLPMILSAFLAMGVFVCAYFYVPESETWLASQRGLRDMARTRGRMKRISSVSFFAGQKRIDKAVNDGLLMSEEEDDEEQGLLGAQHQKDERRGEEPAGQQEHVVHIDVEETPKDEGRGYMPEFTQAKNVRDKLGNLLRFMMSIPLRTVWVYVLLGMATIAVDEVMPLYLKTVHNLGGLDFSAQQISFVIMAGGLALLLWQLLGYEKLVAVIGPVRALRYGLLLVTPACFLPPLLRQTVALAKSPVPVMVMSIGQVFRAVCLGSCYPSNFILTNNSCRTSERAMINGIGQSMVSGGRMLAPLLSGSTYALSLSLVFMPTYLRAFIPFSLVAILFMIAFMIATTLPTSLENPCYLAVHEENDTKTKLLKESGQCTNELADSTRDEIELFAVDDMDSNEEDETEHLL